MYRDQYFLNFFEGCNRTKEEELEATNRGVNPRVNGRNSKSSQIDFIMQALHLLPDDESIALVDYDNKRIFTTIAN